MKNVTVALPEDVARWARVWAAKHDVSLSQMLADFLTEKMKEESAYQQSMQEFLVKEPKPLKSAGSSYPSRDELHDR
jgi:plasmid stability protein